MKIRIRAMAFFLSMFFCTAALTSCTEDDGSGCTFKMNIVNNPKNLDPQLAEDSESIMVLVNMMEGLMRVDGSGAVVTAASESFSMSEDGLRYTFYLRQDRAWESVMEDFSAPVTADDFVYAFKRLCDPETASPYSQDYCCVKNFAAVYSGVLPSNQLGVKALDDYTVEFTLEYPYYDFLSLLAKPAAMPCCREFFEMSKGRYGMAADACASNGAFYLKEWNFDPYWDNNYLILRRNNSYSAGSRVYPYSLNFFITGGSSDDKEDFSDGDIQCFVSEEYDEKLFADNIYAARQTRVAGLLINIDSEYLGNKGIREALARSINRESFSYKLTGQFSPAYGIIPAASMVQGKSYRELQPDRLLSVYDAGAARLWQDALRSAGLESVDGIKITVSENFLGGQILYDITDRWRGELLFDCGVETVSQTEYEGKLESGEYSIALVEYSADDSSPLAFLEQFLDIGGAELAADIAALKRAGSLSEAVELVGEAEQTILDDYLFIPLCYENEYLISEKESADLVYYPFYPAVWFGDAKYFN